MRMMVILRLEIYCGSDSPSTHLLSLTVTDFLHFVAGKSGFTVPPWMISKGYPLANFAPIFGDV